MAEEQVIESEEIEEAEVPDFSGEVDQSAGLEVEASQVGEGELESAHIDALDVDIKLTEDQEKEICDYLATNLPNLKPSEDDERRVRSYMAMYEMSVKKRNFPYENAPSLASTDAHNQLNDWLDKAETAFLRNGVTFAVDREETSLDEEAIRRMEITYHKKFFWKSGLANELRLILFESGFLGTSIVAVREQYDLMPIREKVFIRDENDLSRERRNLTESDYAKAMKAVAEGKVPFITERDTIKVVNCGPVGNRVNQTKFWYPRNAPLQRDWQIVAEQEMYTKSDLQSMAEEGLLDKAKVEKAIESRRQMYQTYQEREKDSKRRTLEDVKPHPLDCDWSTSMEKIKKFGEVYDDEFYVYRVTMLYKIPTSVDPSGTLRSWVQVLYCPAADCILKASFCQDGCPYFLIRYRPVPYKSMGMGIAQERFPHNALDSDMKSLFLASIEQEIGSPTLIRKGSSLWASQFRTYPGAVAYADDIDRDAKVFPFPDKSRLAVEGMRIVLGSSVGANKGAGYASGKREEILQGVQDVSDKARMHSISIDLDQVANACWKILCRMSKMNTPNRKIIDWVYDDKPVMGPRLFMLEDEMDPRIVWSSVLSATTLSPDARFQQALQLKEIFHDNVPASVNSPKLTIGWLNFLANFRSEMDEKNRKMLLPSPEDFMQFQQQLGQMGGQRDEQPATPLSAQSPATPFRNPAARR